MADIILVYCLVSDHQEAEKLARIALEKNLAACVNVMAECHSYFEWDGKFSQDTEVPVIFKTTQERSEELCQVLADEHSYDVPAIVTVPVTNGHQPFLDWIKQSV